MFLVGPYTHWTILYDPYTNVQPPERPKWVIRYDFISFRDYLVNCKWKDNIASLHVSGGSLYTLTNTIWFLHQHTATGTPKMGYPTWLYCIPGLSGKLWMERQYCISACFRWVTIHIGQYYMIPQWAYSPQNAQNGLSDMSLFLSGTFRSIGKISCAGISFSVNSHTYDTILYDL